MYAFKVRVGYSYKKIERSRELRRDGVRFFYNYARTGQTYFESIKQ